jgi:phage shock protein A
MINTFWTLLRGAAHEVEQQTQDRAALLVLDQHIRDAAVGIDQAKRALAIAIAQDETEGQRLDATLARISDLEERAAAALKAGRDDMATEAAEAIALMEADRNAMQEARSVFAVEIARLRRDVAGAGHRFSDLERGRRIAQAAESVRRLRTGVRSSGGPVGLAEAEATLRRLRERQREDAAAQTALEAMDTRAAGAAIAGRLEAAGFGRRTKPTAASVLERLRQRAAASTTSVPPSSSTLSQ